MSRLQRFKGCLLGGLVGDCLGAPFETELKILPKFLQSYFQKVLDPSVVVPFKPYTDDTAMVKVATESLVANKGYDAKDMAKRFTYEYFNEPKRGYGAAIHSVFFKLRKDNYENPYLPAKEQFNGLGSYGNGAAMRVAPVALFAYNKKPEDVQYLIDLVKQASELTHSNKWGYRGAILQALAIRNALEVKEGKIADVHGFTDSLIDHMREIEKDDDPLDPLDKDKSYVKKLTLVKEFLALKERPDLEKLQLNLGVAVSALNSVPTAIYCALAAQKPIEGIDTENIFVRGIHYAISWGGDTDTIACMTGSILGAQLGSDAIPSQFLVHSEVPDIIEKLAEELYYTK